MGLIVINVLFLVATLYATGRCQDCVYWDDTTIPSVMVELTGGAYSVSLEGGQNTDYIEHWQIKTFNGVPVSVNTLKYGEILTFDPQDCDNTNYQIVMKARCPNADKYGPEEIFIELHEFRPIPLDKSASFQQSDYNVLRSQLVNAGEKATLTCQTDEEANMLYEFKPFYTWLRYEAFTGEQTVVDGPSQSANTLVIESVGCKDAGYYYCKVTKCSYHQYETAAACNNNDLAVQLGDKTPATATIDYRKCKIFGDPHIFTFDGSMYSYKGQCWYVLATEDSPQGGNWFIYGWFNACGETSSCLETISIITKETERTSRAQIQLLRGYGMSIDGRKKFIKRGTRFHYKDGISAQFSGDSLTVSIPEFGLEVKWDGLAVAIIKLNQNTRTNGLCGNNDGDASNDYTSFYDRVERSPDKFADVWSIGTGGRCILSQDFPEEKASIFSLEDLLRYGANPSNFPETYLREACRSSVNWSGGSPTQLSFVADRMPKDRLNAIIEACVSDIRNTEHGFYAAGYNFPGCIPLSIIADEAEELGICVDDWQVTARCPIRVQWREESIRIGCLWTDVDFATVRS